MPSFIFGFRLSANHHRIRCDIKLIIKYKKEQMTTDLDKDMLENLTKDVVLTS